jgi:hypothetical protein
MRMTVEEEGRERGEGVEGGYGGRKARRR